MRIPPRAEQKSSYPHGAHILTEGDGQLNSVNSIRARCVKAQVAQRTMGK